MRPSMIQGRSEQERKFLMIASPRIRLMMTQRRISCFEGYARWYTGPPEIVSITNAADN